MPPSLATYQQAASQIYEPQKAAEQAKLTTEKQNTISTLEGGKAAINTDYQQAVDALTTSIKQNTATINQLYTERLGGNFSGLQGNDLGMMFSTAQKQQSNIEQSRANKLSDIAIQEANTSNTYDTEIGSLGSKYQSLEADYAQGNYGSAVKEYNTQQYQQQRLGLEYAKLNQSATTKAAALPSESQVRSAIQQGLQSVTGRNGYVSPQDYAQGLKQWLAAGLSRAAYNKQYSNYRDPKNGYYDYAVKQAGL